MNRLEEELAEALRDHAERFTPGPDGWARTQARLERYRRRRWAVTGLAAAATTVVIIALLRLAPPTAPDRFTWYWFGTGVIDGSGRPGSATLLFSDATGRQLVSRRVTVLPRHVPMPR
ncbi:hypothetical protein [Actinomadura opuntiae]|uniref:hypothetical protein n=1 Tax=Actinomadura sp. OS1-43 TaxID=604315 RepID=UPI00255A7713|nr:hypothetical protein [Actinomadura sp. OS1-43]MDL4814167.1 hypothetical protein [Actinomadura sp. OS1-43]